MATTRLIPLHTGKLRTEGAALQDIIDYVINPLKTEKGELVTGFACDPQTAGGEFLLAKREYITRTGRKRGKDDVIAYHLRQSFAPGEITPEKANQIGCELARRFTHGNHAYLVATHTDRHHIHNHIIIHSINLDCDRKFRNFWGSSKAIRRLNDTLCITNGLSIVENPKPKPKRRSIWPGDQPKPTQRDDLRMAIDDALCQKPADLDALLALLQAAGWEVKRGKHIALRGVGQQRFKRLSSLGEDYSEAALKAALSGEKALPERKQTSPAPQPVRINLLVDIQAKLRAGKGPGYERWAKVFNLKQMAQTMNYLSEHGLLEYDVLAQKAEAATARYNELSDKISAAEKRMAEIATLRTHILHYIKTRDVYTAYRKAGYSKQFLAQHEQEILLHKAAKKAFDELGVAKLPTIKALQAEHAELFAQKKNAYGEYRKARDEMRELLMVKANVDRILGEEQAQKHQEAER